MCKEYWTLSSLIRHIVTRQMMAKYGIWSPDSQTKMIKIGWRTKGYGGMTSKSPWEQQQIHRITPTWSHSHFGCSGAKSLRSRAVMIPVTFHTTGNCLARQTFRSKISGYGDFRNGSFWASKQCLGSCTVQYSGQYKSTLRRLSTGWVQWKHPKRQ